jgi:large subunit ribosomal protein L9
MATEVILMTDVADLGSEGDVVTVSDGYARNYLFPKKIGAPVTEATRRRLAKIRVQREDARKMQLTAARELAARLEKVSCTIPVKAAENEKLYGSVTVAEIAEALKKQGIEIDKHCLDLEAPIKSLGIFDVKVKLHPEVESSIKVWIVEE